MVTIKGMIGSPYNRAIHKHGKDLTSPIIMSCSSTHKLVALVACGRGLDLGCGWWAVMVCIVSIPMLPLLYMYHAS